MGVLTLLLTFAAPWFASSLITKNKRIGGRGRVARVLFATLFPFPGLLWVLFSKNRRKGLSSDGKAVVDSQYVIDNTKLKLERQERRVKRLRNSRGLFAKQRLLRADRNLDRTKTELQELYLTYGAAKRRAVSAHVERFLAVRVDRLSDGTLRFNLPYDMTRQQLQDLKQLIAKQYGVDTGDIEKVMVTMNRGTDFAYFGTDKFTLVYDTQKNTLNRLGKDIDKTVIDSIKLVNDEFTRRVPKIDDIELERQGCLRMAVLGPDSVALSMNGVVLAYAICGEDGVIRLRGTDVVPGDRNAMRIAGRLQESLKDCTSIQQWVERAGDICLSSLNVKNARLAVEDDKRRKFSKAERKKEEKGLLVAPGVNFAKVARGIGR